MKKSDELKKVVDSIKAQMEGLQQKEDYTNAAKLVNELSDAIAQYEVAKSIEAAELTNVKQGATPINSVMARDSVLENRIFNKNVLGRRLNSEELEYMNAIGSPGQVEGIDSKGGYLVPEEQISILREYRKAYTALKDFAHVQIANSSKGKMPTLGDESGLLVNFEELNAIKESDFDFGQLTYTINDYGDIIPVSNQLLQDADINIMSVVGQRFARKAVNTENSEILTLLGKLTAGKISSYNDLTRAINVDLDPAYYGNTRILTNQDGFQWLAELVDGNGRPLLVPDVAAPDTYRFRGKEIVVVSNNLLATKSSKIPFYVGSISDYVAFFERKGVEVAVSTDYMFNKYATALRCIERFGVVADDTDAVKSYTVTVSTT